jgi:hypothetical protein
MFIYTLALLEDSLRTLPFRSHGLPALSYVSMAAARACKARPADGAGEPGALEAARMHSSIGPTARARGRRGSSSSNSHATGACSVRDPDRSWSFFHRPYRVPSGPERTPRATAYCSSIMMDAHGEHFFSIPVPRGNISTTRISIPFKLQLRHTYFAINVKHCI